MRFTIPRKRYTRVQRLIQENKYGNINQRYKRYIEIPSFKECAGMLFKCTCFLLFLVKFALCIQHYLNYPTRNVVSTINENFENPPAFTICNANRFKKSELKMFYDSLELKRADEKWEVAAYFEAVRNENITFHVSLGHRKEDLLNGEDSAMIPLDSWSLAYHLEFGNCFVLNGNYSRKAKALRTVSEMKEIYFSEMFFEYDEYIHIRRKEPPSAIIAIHNPLEIVDLSLTGLSLTPGYNLLVKFEKVSRVLLPYPYESNCVDYQQMKSMSSLQGEVSEMMCELNCYIKEVRKHHNLLNTTDMFATHFPIPVELFMPFKIQENMSFSKPQDLKMMCRKYCPEDCRSLSYRFKVFQEYKYSETNVKLNRTRDQALMSGKLSSDLTVSYGSKKYRSYAMEPQIQRIEFFGYLGGYLGMLFGIFLLRTGRSNIGRH